MEAMILNPFLVGLGRVSLQAGLLVLVVLLAQWLFRKWLSPSWRCALWLLVVGRLLLPISIASTLSLFNLLPHWTDQGPSTPKSQGTGSRPATPPQVERVTGQPLAAPDNGVASADRRISRDSSAATALVSTPGPAVEIARGFHASLTLRKPVPWTALVFWTWLCGALLLAGHVAVCSVRLSRQFANVSPLADPSVLAVLDDCRARLRMDVTVPVMESDAVPSPVLHGLFRPRLLLPKGLAGTFSPRELQFIFLHELAHLKRRDLPLNWLMAGLQVVHWFNPLIWVGFARWRADRELACDALALEAVGLEQNLEYGRTILRLLEGFTQSAGSPGLVGILENKNQLRQRIKMIATYVPGRRWQVLALGVAGAIAITGLTDAQNKRPVVGEKGNSQPAASPAHSTNESFSMPLRPVVTNGRVMKVVVLDSGTGLPLPNAEVLAPNHAAFFSGEENAPQWLTDDQGIASIHLGKESSNHLEEKSWFTLSVRHGDYAPRGLSWSAQNKDARPGMPAEITVRLEKGLAIGGVVQEEAGAPAAGVRVRVFGTGYWFGLRHEYAEFWSDTAGLPPLATDSSGRWQLKDFPKDLDAVTIELIRPDGSSQRFRKKAEGQELDSREPGDPINMDDLRAGKAQFVLKSGFDLRGVVLDPKGRPAPGTLIKVGSGLYNMARHYETRTDAAGRFQLHHLLRRQIFLTAYPSAFAITSVVIDSTTNPPEVRLPLTELRPLRIRVLDGAGGVVAGAKVSVDSYRTESQALEFEGTTDRDGMLIWSNAPVSAFALVASSPVIQCRQKIRLEPGQRDVTFKLREGLDREILVTGRVIDSKTRASVKLESVTYQTADQEGFVFEGDIVEPGFRLAVPVTKFRPGGFYPILQLQLRAKGYAILITPWRDFDEGDWEPEFALRPASESSRTILLADGKAASAARIWIPPDHNAGPLYLNQPDRYYGDRLIKKQADADGKFELPDFPEDLPVVITHSDGFLATSLAEIQHNPIVRLHVWGRVEGIFKLAGQPKRGVPLHLSKPWTPTDGFHLIYTTTTASDGSFTFTKVPAGDYKVYRGVTARNGRSIAEDHQMPLNVKPGEGKKLEYSVSGRAVVGQARADRPELTVDWLNDDHTLTLKQPSIPQLNSEDFASIKGFEEERAKSDKSPERMKLNREARTYVLEFEPDGSFRAEDVPPGTYELRILLNKPGQTEPFRPFSNQKGNLGSLIREVVVPTGGGVYDLGTLVVPVKGDSGVKPSEVMNLDAKTLDGQSISLEQFKGQHLLVAFWASWSERSLAQLPDLQKLQSDLGPDARISFLSVSVDEDAEAVRKAVEMRGYKWKQAWLDTESRAKVTAAFDVNALPAFFLIGPDGRVVGRDLEGERLRFTVQRALAKK